MNNVNSISQMNSMVCEHSSLIGPDVKKGPIIGEQGPDGKTILNITLIFHKTLVVSYFGRWQQRIPPSSTQWQLPHLTEVTISTEYSVCLTAVWVLQWSGSSSFSRTAHVSRGRRWSFWWIRRIWKVNVNSTRASTSSSTHGTIASCCLHASLLGLQQQQEST